MASTNKTIIGRNSVVLISGGSSGIGLALGQLFARAGAHVWLLSRQEERLKAALEVVKAARQEKGQRCGYLRTDVSDPLQAAAAAEQVASEIGVPHVLINSAGVARPGYFQELDLQAFRWMMETNYFGTVHMIQAVLPGMLSRASGHIVNIASAAGFLGVYGYSAYAATKFAVSGLSEVLRAELKPRGIGVSIVFPPDVDTPQLAYESQFRPLETHSLVDGGQILSPDSVAREILRGISRGIYTILPGSQTKALYILRHLIGNAAYPVMDLLIARAQRKAGIKTKRT